MDEIRNAYALPGIPGNIDKVAHTVPPKWLDDYLPIMLSIATSAYQVKLKDVLGKNRAGELVYIRQMIMHWCRTHYSKACTVTKLGRYFGTRDHTTVLHSTAKFRDRLDTDCVLPQRILDIRDYPVETTKPDYETMSKLFTNACWNIWENRSG